MTRSRAHSGTMACAADASDPSALMSFVHAPDGPAIREPSDRRAEPVSPEVPTLGLDLDGCIDEAPAFFRLLTRHWPGRVVVISYRFDRIKAERDLARYGIRYDELVLVQSFGAKADVIAEQRVTVYFDDQPEMLKNVPATVAVMLVRNGGNFDYDDRMWMFSDQTGKRV